MSFNESRDVYGNTPGLGFIANMEARVRKLSTEIAELQNEAAVRDAKLEKKIEESSAKLQKEAAVTTAKLEKKIEESEVEMTKKFLEETRKLREEIERSTDIVENIRRA